MFHVVFMLIDFHVTVCSVYDPNLPLTAAYIVKGCVFYSCVSAEGLQTRCSGGVR